jgi:hypothetical protein
MSVIFRNGGVMTPQVAREAKPVTDFDKYLNRVGRSSKEQWKWLLRVVNDYRKDKGESWLPGEWDIVCGELAAFTLGDRSLPGYGAMTMTKGKFDNPPKQADAKEILDTVLKLVDAAVEHRPVTLQTLSIQPSLHWKDQLGRYVLSAGCDEDATWPDRVLYPLAQLVSEEGHRLRRCLSKRPHEGKACDNYFLKAKRGKYCGPACTSREMSRAKRLREQQSEDASETSKQENQQGRTTRGIHARKRPEAVTLSRSTTGVEPSKPVTAEHQAEIQKRYLHNEKLKAKQRAKKGAKRP